MPETITVQEGDSIASLAFSRGLLPDKVWSHPDNSELKSIRSDMNALHPGDTVVLQDKEKKQESCATDAKHKFRRKAVPALLRIRIMQDVIVEETDDNDEHGHEEDIDTVYTDEDVETIPSQEPRKNCPYRMKADGILVEGRTDGDGMLEESVSPDIQSVILVLNPDTEGETTLKIAVGTTKPFDQITGAKERLANLGYDCGNRDKEIDESFQFVLALFQHENNLDVTSVLDAVTKEKIKTLHGS